MNKGKVTKYILVLVFLAVAIGSGIAFYMFNMPHRDVAAAKADISVDASVLVGEFLGNAKAANEKYLDESGDSKILLVTGNVTGVSEDFAGNAVVLLKSDAKSPSAVSATFIESAHDEAMKVTTGEKITVKGVIRSGASYDADLQMYEDVILEKSTLIK